MKLLRNKTLAALLAFSLGTTAFAAGGEQGEIKNIDFTFDGPFGAFDQYQLQRGAQVYQEVCAACHGLRLVAFRNLGDEGGPHFSDGEVKGYASNFEVYDAEKDEDRTAGPNDKFPGSALENAPDLSLMAKARAGFHGPYGLGINQALKGMGGPEYIVALLNGYTGKEKEEAGVTLYENTAFPGGWISMAKPLEDDQVEFADGATADLKHASEDVAAFLMWTAEPKLMARKRIGMLSVAMLSLLALLLYLTNKKLWRDVKYKA